MFGVVWFVVFVGGAASAAAASTGNVGLATEIVEL